MAVPPGPGGPEGAEAWPQAANNFTGTSIARDNMLPLRHSPNVGAVFVRVLTSRDVVSICREQA
jgi:hypothetical protein